MPEPFSNGLSPAEAERLALLAEECGEVVQIIGKVLRHGYASYHPENPTGPTNRHMLENELGHVMAAILMMTTAMDLSRVSIGAARVTKTSTVGRWLHHQTKGET